MCKKCLIVTIVFLLAVIAGFFIVLNTKAQGNLSVVINEIAWMGSEVQEVESKNWWRYEWLELYNMSEQSLTLDGWTLELYREELDWKLEIHGTIASHGYFLIASSDKISNADFNYSKLDGKFVNSGQRVLLKDANGTIIDDVDARSSWFAGGNETKQTMERKNPELSGSNPASWATSLNTGGTPKAISSTYANNLSSSEDSEQKTNNDGEQITADQNTNTVNAPINTTAEDEEVIHGAEIRQNENNETNQQTNETTPKDTAINPSNTASSANNTGQEQDQIVYPSNIYVNELMPSSTGDDSLEEWIEITNENNEQINLSGWQIRDTKGITNTYTLPVGSVIGTSAFIVLSRPTTNITLNNDSDGLELLKPNGKIFQKISYEGAKKGFAYVRSDNKWSWSNVPTPGSENIVTNITKTNNANESNQSTAKVKTSKKDQTPHVKKDFARYSMDETSTNTDAMPSRLTASALNTGQNYLDSKASKDSSILVAVLALIIATGSGVLIFIIKKRSDTKIRPVS